MDEINISNSFAFFMKKKNQKNVLKIWLGSKISDPRTPEKMSNPILPFKKHHSFKETINKTQTKEVRKKSE